MSTKGKAQRKYKHPGHIRVPTPKPTEWHRDKKKYNRKEKYRRDYGY
jgi:hypothetical protein